MRFIFSAVVLLTALFTCDTSAAERGPGPFTHAPRSVRSRDVDQQHLRLQLGLDFENQVVYGTATHRVDLFKPLKQIELDAAGMKINKISVGQTEFTEAKFRHENNKLWIDLPADAPQKDLLVVIDYVITKPQHGMHFVMPDPNEPGALTMAWTQSEPEFARYWFPCFDHPSDRLTSETIITAPENFFVLSNGALKEKKPGPNKTTTWHWTQQKSHVAYLLSVVAGDFEALEQEWDGIPVISYVPRGRLADAKICFDKTPKMVAYFSKQFGFRYPWEKYTQICVDEYNWGGMEHTSCTTLNLGTLHDERADLNEARGTENLVAHELAHQWWGDVVTCKDWGELWLNESFATYFATMWNEHENGWDEAVWDRRGDAQSYFGEDERYRRSIVSYKYDRPESMFDSHTYPKGGRVLHMLRFELGDELFWKALRHYIEVNQFRTVETADFRRAIEDVSGQGMNWFFDQWLDQGGHPEFNVSWSYNAETKQTAVTIKQTQKVDALTPLFQTSVEVEIATPTDTTTHRLKLTKAEETFHLPAAERPTRVVFDPRDWLLDKLTQDKSKEELLDQLVRDEHVFARFQAVQGLEAKKDDADVGAAIKKAAKYDSFWAVREEATKIASQLSGDDTRKLLIDLATGDADVHVRRQAIDGLGKFSHDETKAALRKVIAEEKSYKNVAEALRTLVKVDRDGCKPDLERAVALPSHREEIFKAAAAGLNELKHQAALDDWQAMLREKLTAEKRAAVIEVLAAGKHGDSATLDLLKAQLDHRRLNIRRQTITAIVDIGPTQGVDWLSARRGKEESPRMITTIDEAIEKLKARNKQNEPIKKEIDELREKNRLLEERLKKLEKE